jgi:hypothetical protein
MSYEPVVRAKIKTLLFTEKNADASAMMDDSKVIDHIQKAEQAISGQRHRIRSCLLHGFHQTIQEYLQKQKKTY